MWHVFFVALFGIFKAYAIKGATSQSENLANKRLIVFFFFLSGGLLTMEKNTFYLLFIAQCIKQLLNA